MSKACPAAPRSEPSPGPSPSPQCGQASTFTTASSTLKPPPRRTRAILRPGFAVGCSPTGGRSAGAALPDRGPRALAGDRRGFSRLPQPRDVDLAHLEHRPHHPVHLVLVGVVEHLLQLRGIHLPGEAVLVLQPAARPVLPALDRKSTRLNS